MDKREQIVVDCERMKTPNTGLYAFCDHLAARLAARCPDGWRHRLAFYVPPALSERWGSFVYHCWAGWHALWLPFKREVRVWHATYQLSSYVPRLRRGAVVLTVHDLNFLYDKPKHKHRRYIDKLQRTVDRCDHLVAISEFTRRDLLRYIDTKGKPVDVIYNGCNLFHGTAEAPAEPPRREFLFCVCLVLPKKNLHVLPCLLVGNDYELVLAGNDADAAYKQKILEEAARWGVQHRVRFAGAVSEPVKHWYLQHCKAFVFPSIAEGFGLPVIEAMYYQKPLFLSRRVCLPEIGGDYAYYFNNDFRREQMQEEFRRGMEHFESGGMDKEAMRCRAMSFSWDTAADKYWEIYRKWWKRCDG